MKGAQKRSPKFDTHPKGCFGGVVSGFLEGIVQGIL